MKKIIKNINNNKINNELKEIKQLLIEKEKNNDLINKKINFNKYDLINVLNNNKIISIAGTNGESKSIFTIKLANLLNNNKILIIDFDILNNSLHTLLGKKKYSQKIRNKIKNNNLLKEIKIPELIIKINSKIDLISGINLLFDSKYKISSKKIKNILKILELKYDVIIIDTSSECFFDYTKEIMKNSNINIFLLENNFIEIQKAKKLLNIYINNWEIKKENINIIFNKYNNQINISKLKNNFEILKKLSTKTI